MPEFDEGKAGQAQQSVESLYAGDVTNVINGMLGVHFNCPIALKHSGVDVLLHLMFACISCWMDS